MTKPEAAELFFYGTLAIMVAVELIEWPIAVAVAVGHKLAHHAHTDTGWREVGEALEEAK